MSLGSGDSPANAVLTGPSHLASGFRPYNPKLTAVQNVIVALLTYGEGWHNFHHAFPTDFRCADKWYQWNPTREFINLCALFGQAWDLKMRKARSA